VVEIGGGGGQVQTGIVVDSVSEVLNVKAEEIEDTPYFGLTLETDFILGMAKMEGGVKILLDIDRVLAGVEIDDFESMEDPGPVPSGEDLGGGLETGVIQS
jgi:purine-binding chemotaxis protein CheW